MTNNYEGVPSVAFLERLRELKAACGWPKDKHAVATVLIMACIEEGVATRAQIIGALKSIGLDYRHVAIILNEGTGGAPARHRWRLDGEGRYSLADVLVDNSTFAISAA